MGTKINSQQAPVQWLRKITKAKLNLFIPIFLLKQWEKREKGKFGQFWASLGNFVQVWESLGKLRQVRTRQHIRKMGEKAKRIRKGKKF